MQQRKLDTMNEKWKRDRIKELNKVKCTNCDTMLDTQKYNDLEELFQSRKDNYYCKPCHDSIFDMLERRCVCNAKIRNCCC